MLACKAYVLCVVLYMLTNSYCNLALPEVMSARWATVMTCKLTTGAHPGLATMHVAIA